MARLGSRRGGPFVFAMLKLAHEVLLIAFAVLLFMAIGFWLTVELVGPGL